MDSQKGKLFSKNGIAAQQIARIVLSIEVDHRFPRVDDLVERLHLARGTVQGAIRLLEQMKAIQLEARGHLGTFLRNKNQSLLWELAGLGTIVGMMPLPYSKRYEGLATGFVEAFEEMQIPFHISHVRGADNRIKAVQTKRCDFAIISQWAAEKACQDHADLVVHHQLGERTFVGTHGILFANKQINRIQPGMRVGIDLSSPDQRDLTYAECENLAVEMVELNYMQIFLLLENGQIDAAVWNLDEFSTTSQWGIGTFHSPTAKKINQTLSQAVILEHRLGSEVSSLLTSLSYENIIEIQQQVLQGKKLPHY